MTRLALLLGFCLMLFSQPALAGAWARGKGKVFASTSTFATWPAARPLDQPDIFGAAYAEFGLSHSLTAGLDMGTPDYSDPSRLRAVGFLRYTLSDPSARHQFAVDLGGGRDQGRYITRLGLSYGTGLSLMGQSGWLAVDAFVLHAPGLAEQSLSIDATLGLSLSKTKYIAQISASRPYRGGDTLAITPSLVREILPGTRVEIGASFGLKGKPDPAIKLGIWREF